MKKTIKPYGPLKNVRLDNCDKSDILICANCGEQNMRMEKVEVFGRLEDGKTGLKVVV